MQSRKIWWLIVPALVLGVSAYSFAGDDEKRTGSAPKAGDRAPDFELTSIDGKTYKLSDLKDKIVVLEWWNQDCPYSNFTLGTAERTKKMAEEYGRKGVVWLAIDTTLNQTKEKNAEYAKEKKITYPILMDTDGKVGRLYGAKTTPHMFVINKGKIVYSGAFGENPRRAKDKSEDEYRSYAGEALQATMENKEPPVDFMEPWGCTVKYKQEK